MKLGATLYLKNSIEAVENALGKSDKNDVIYILQPKG
jgi:hypothetical protein